MGVGHRSWPARPRRRATRRYSRFLPPPRKGDRQQSRQGPLPRPLSETSVIVFVGVGLCCPSLLPSGAGCASRRCAAVPPGAARRLCRSVHPPVPPARRPSVRPVPLCLPIGLCRRRCCLRARAAPSGAVAAAPPGAARRLCQSVRPSRLPDGPSVRPPACPVESVAPPRPPALACTPLAGRPPLHRCIEHRTSIGEAQQDDRDVPPTAPRRIEHRTCVGRDQQDG